MVIHVEYVFVLEASHQAETLVTRGKSASKALVVKVEYFILITLASDG